MVFRGLRECLRRILSRDSMIICIGNYMRRDDAAGLVICRMVKYRVRFNNIFDCEGGLENCFRLIEKIKPRRILVVDAAEFNGEPGDVVLTNAIECDLELSLYSTHKIPINLAARFVKSFYGVEDIWVLGVKPADTSVGFGLSKRVLESCRVIAELLVEVLSSL